MPIPTTITTTNKQPTNRGFAAVSGAVGLGILTVGATPAGAAAISVVVIVVVAVFIVVVVVVVVFAVGGGDGSGG